MAMTPPLINGSRFDFASVRASFAGRFFEDFDSISYSHSLEPGVVHGTRAGIIGRTRGQYTAEGSFTMLKSTYQQLIAALGPGYMERSFNITCIHANDGEPSVTDLLIGCRIVRDEDAHSAGNEPLKVNVTLSVINLIRGGLPATLDAR